MLSVVLGWTCVAAALDAASVRDATGTLSSATMLLSGTTPVGGTCVSTGSAITTNSASCPGSPYPSGQLSSTTASSATSSLGSAGNFAPTSASLSAACGVAQFADTSSAATNGALPFYGVSFGAPGPMGQFAAALDGTTGFAETRTSFANPESFTLLAWFKTTAPGTIAGFSNTQYARATTTNDRNLWVDDTGRLVWAVGTPSAPHEIVSTTTVDTGTWVFAAATVGAAGSALYVNGTLAASSAITSARNYTGWWHLGWGAETNWPDAPSGAYLSGDLAEVAVVPTQLTATQVAALQTASAGGAASYVSALGALTPTSSWQLSDSGSVAFTGSVPALGAPACPRVMVTVQATRGTTTTCVYPVAAGACPAPSSAYLLSSLPVSSMSPPLGGSPVSLVVTLRLTAASGVGVAGLHLLPGFTISSAVAGTLWNASLSFAAGSVEL